MSVVIWPVAIGALLGAGLGYFGRCSSGTCPLTSTWWRGALYGGAIGAMFAWVSGGRVAPNGENAQADSSNVVHISQAEFATRVLQADRPVLVDFYAPWCGPCLALAPTIAELADEYAGRVQITKINVDQAPGISQEYRIESIPMLLFFRNGKIVDSTVGLISERELRSRLDKLIGAGAAPVGGATHQ